MDTPGNLLKAEREKQKKSFEDIGKILKINIEYLKAIEKDNYQQLPADVFTKSYLRSYSETLGLESNYILSLYKKQFGPPPAKNPEPPEKAPWKILPPLKFKYIYPVMICIALITFSVITFTKRKTDEPAVGAMVSVKEVKKPEIAKEANQKELSLEIVARKLTWVSIKIDSAKSVEQLLRAGEAITLKANEKFALKIGNAGGTSLIFNGMDIGALGPNGQVVDIVLP